MYRRDYAEQEVGGKERHDSCCQLSASCCQQQSFEGIKPAVHEAGTMLGTGGGCSTLSPVFYHELYLQFVIEWGFDALYLVPT
jgi:hypothetical protein